MAEKVLVPLDGSGAAEQILPLLQHLLDCGQVSEVVLARAETPTTPVVYDYVLAPQQLAAGEESSLRDATGYLQAIERRLRFGEASHRTAVLLGPPHESLPRFAEREAFDRVLLGLPEKKGLLGRMHRRRAERLAHAFRVPVRVCSPPECTALGWAEAAC